MAGGLLDEVSAETAASLARVAGRRRYPARTYLFHAGDPAASVYLIDIGLVRIDRTLQSGQQVLLTLARPGDLVGDLSLFAGSPRSATASTVTEVRTMVIQEDSFLELIEDKPDLGRALLRRVSRRLLGLTDQLLETTWLTARARIAARLVDLMATVPNDDVPVELPLPISQGDLARWAGLSREGAVKGLGELRAEGIIETGRMKVTVLRPDRLQELADEAAL